MIQGLPIEHQQFVAFSTAHWATCGRTSMPRFPSGNMRFYRTQFDRKVCWSKVLGLQRKQCFSLLPGRHTTISGGPRIRLEQGRALGGITRLRRNTEKIAANQLRSEELCRSSKIGDWYPQASSVTIEGERIRPAGLNWHRCSCLEKPRNCDLHPRFLSEPIYIVVIEACRISWLLLVFDRQKKICCIRWIIVWRMKRWGKCLIHTPGGASWLFQKRDVSKFQATNIYPS